MKAAGPRGRKNFGLALGTALIAGGVGLGILREAGVVTRPEVGEVQMAAERAGPVVPDEDVFVETPDLVWQVLRTDANQSTVEDRRVIWNFLRQSCRAEERRVGVNWMEVDEALTWLRSAEATVPELEGTLLQTASDSALLEPLRCFALHHLGVWAQRHSVEFSTVMQLRWLTEFSQSGAVVSAALRVLNELRSSPDEEEWLRMRILQLLDEKAGGSSEQRVVALQIAVELGAGEAEPFARGLALTSRQPAERVAAFLALGHLGDWETLRWINSQAEPFETLVKDAKRVATMRLAGR